jgi:hypothetical protein
MNAMSANHQWPSERARERKRRQERERDSKCKGLRGREGVTEREGGREGGKEGGTVVWKFTFPLCKQYVTEFVYDIHHVYAFGSSPFPSLVAYQTFGGRTLDGMMEGGSAGPIRVLTRNLVLPYEDRHTCRPDRDRHTCPPDRHNVGLTATAMHVGLTDRHTCRPDRPPYMSA